MKGPRKGGVATCPINPALNPGSHLVHTPWQGAHVDRACHMLWVPGLLSPGAQEGKPQPGLSQSLSYDPAPGQLCPFLHLPSPSPGTGKHCHPSFLSSQPG